MSDAPDVTKARALRPASWPKVGSNVIDMDEATPNKQWVDSSGDPPPGGIWYYGDPLQRGLSRRGTVLEDRLSGAAAAER